MSRQPSTAREPRWLERVPFAPRPLVVVEDHLDHLESLRTALTTDLLAQTVFVCLDRPGPDTDRVLERWLAEAAELRVLAATTQNSPVAPGLHSLPKEAFTEHSALARTIAGVLRSGGLLLQDVQLETLRFVPEDRWWETILLASTVRGSFPDDPPEVRFLSNKRGYQATFGARLMEAGFDPRDVLDKDRLEDPVLPVIEATLSRRFPARLQLREPQGVRRALWARGNREECESLANSFDLLAYEPDSGTLELHGRCLADGTLSLEERRVEWPTWRALLGEAVEGRPAPGTEEVGRRMAPAGALAAEISSAAARHVFRIRQRLADPSVLETRDGCYRLRSDLRVGWIR